MRNCGGGLVQDYGWGHFLGMEFFLDVMLTLKNQRFRLIGKSTCSI